MTPMPTTAAATPAKADRARAEAPMTYDALIEGARSGGCTRSFVCLGPTREKPKKGISGMQTSGGPAPLPEQETHVYTDGASTGSRGPGGYGAVIYHCNGKIEEISGGEQDTTNLRMEITAACVALETIEEGHATTVYSDASYLVNCMRRRWYEKWRENGWLNSRKEPVANRDLWERLLRATRRHQVVRWRKVRGHSKTRSAHKVGNDRADELAVAAKKGVARSSIPSST